MTEILTESFCERCGTRYTFEAATPRRRRMSGLKVLGKGLKNFVLSDDSSLDEALAAARSDVELEATTHQLDAFHKTFNFCMTCRQYTCANCWDPVEGRCLSCSTGQMPVLTTPVDAIPLDRGMLIGEEIPPERLALDAWPSADATTSSNDAAALEAATVDAAAADEQPSGRPETLAAATAADLAAESPIAPDGGPLSAEAVAPEVEPAAIDTEPAGIEERASFGADAVEGTIEVAVPLDASADVGEAPTSAPEAVVVEPEPVVVEPEPVAEPAAAVTADAPAAEGDQAPRTRRPRSRFRPGQSLDEEIAAYEARLAAEAAAAELIHADASAPEAVPPTAEPDSTFAPVSPLAEQEPEPAGVADLEPVGIAEPEPVAVTELEPLPAPEPVAAAAEAEPLAPEPEPVSAAAEPEPLAPEPEPVSAATEPVAEPLAPEPEPEPVAAATPSPDTLPTAAPSPFQPTPVPPRPGPELRPPAPTAPVAPTTPAAPPSWPTAPRWPAPVQPAASADRAPIGDPLAAALARRATDAMWAASAQDIVRLPMPSHAAPAPAVQSCQSCGLSLSATARFCRRCGARQDG